MTMCCLMALETDGCAGYGMGSLGGLMIGSAYDQTLLGTFCH